MRIVEESYLKRTVSKLNKYAAQHKQYAEFFNDLDELEIKPLQDLSFQSDLKYFEELNFILSVVSSIISHPHISNTGEHIIVRTELANTISSDTFQQTMRDAKLWRNDGLKMVPEYVYYYQNIDELCIYENVFIVTLIKLIDAELIKYNDFYVSLIETFDGQEALSLSSNNVNVAFNKIKRLTRKLKYVKNTYFYKEISRRSPPLKTVHPTNILLKDRLYNYCFKFYRSLISYSDKQTLLRDFRMYHFVLLLRALKSRGFTVTGRAVNLKKDAYGCLQLPKLRFTGEIFDIVVEPYEELGLKVSVQNRFIKGAKTRTASHLLVFEPKESTFDLKKIREDTKVGFETIEAVHLWNLVYVDEKISVSFRNPLSEQALMDKWLESKILHSVASMKIYRTYCPSCKHQTLETTANHHRRCENCGSAFAFYRDGEGKNNIWFLKLRRQK